MSEEQKGATIGAGMGAILGGVAGAALDRKNPGRGAAIGATAGAALGGATGWGVGAYRTKQVKSREQAAADLKYRPQQGVVTRLDGASAIPQQARPGDQLTLQAQYVVLAPPQDGQVIKVKETRTILFNNEPLKHMEKETVLALGTHDLQQLITLPKAAASGPYTVVTTVQPLNIQAARTDEARATFVVNVGGAAATAAPATTADASAPVREARAILPTATMPPAAPTTLSRGQVIEAAVPPVNQKPGLDILYVKIPLANVRDGAGAAFKVLSRVARDTALTVLQVGGTERDRWFKVRLPTGEEGWIAASVVGLAP